MALNYDIVLLDADDTLFDFRRAESVALEESLAAFGYTAPLDEYLGAFQRINAEVWRAYESGTSTSQEIRVRRFVLLLSELSHDADPNALSAMYVARLAQAAFLLPGARELLDALRGAVPLGLVTNGISEVQRSRLALSGVGEYFDSVTISDEVGIQKPDPEIFRVALASLRTAAGPPAGDRVIMIGDGLHSDIRGAIAAGIDSCWFNSRGARTDPDVSATFTVTGYDELYPILGLV